MSAHFLGNIKRVGALFWVKKTRVGARARTKKNGSVHIVGQKNRVGALFGKEKPELVDFVGKLNQGGALFAGLYTFII